MLTDLTTELNQACPNRCMFCSSFAAEHSPHLIDRATLNAVAIQAVRLGLRDISLSGGEPMEHPEIRGICTDLVELGLAIRIYTSGMVRSNGCANSFLAWRGLSTNLSSVVFNIQSMEESVHALLTGRPDALRLTLGSLRSAQDAGYSVDVHIVPNHINIPSLERTIRELWAMGVRQISLLRLVEQGHARRYASNLALKREDQQILTRLATTLQDEVAGGRLRLGIPFSGMVDAHARCNAGLTKLIIRYDGEVFPCEAFKDRFTADFTLGSVYRDSLTDMLARGKSCTGLKELRAQLQGSETCPAQLANADQVLCA